MNFQASVILMYAARRATCQGQLADDQLHAPQLPTFGPAAVPLKQSAVSSHQPHPEVIAQLLHERWVAHGSGGVHSPVV